MAKLRVQGDNSGYVDLEAPTNASSSTLDLDQVPQLNNGMGNTFTSSLNIFETRDTNGYARFTAHSGSAQIGLFRDATGAVGGGYIGADGTNVLDVRDANFASKFKVSQAGYVTKPNQPAFQASTTQNLTLPSGWRDFSDASAFNGHYFTRVTYNVGGHYNPSNSRFTAPISGMYLFYGNVASNGSSPASSYLSFEFYINGARKWWGWNYKDSGYHRESCTRMFYLNAGDFVEPGYETSATIVTLGSNSDDAFYTGFGCYFLG